MPKGHSDIPDRIQALEARVATLEKHILDMREAFNRGAIPKPQTAYEAQFTVWPGANHVSNNT